MSEDRAVIDKLIRSMSADQVRVLLPIAQAICGKATVWRNGKSDVASSRFVEALRCILQLHHAQSEEPFTKDKFEYAVRKVFRLCGKQASLAARGNRGQDIIVGSERWSLKTQADSSISRETIHISKFMELGKGAWKGEHDLAGLRDQMLAHMKSYDRIFSLRYFNRNKRCGKAGHHEYELVEIPKALLAKCARGRLEMVRTSKQNPKPGYCHVSDKSGAILFRLYFDGGTERKLQIKDISKAHCLVHATWDLICPD
jgi:hypothetical protein